MQAAVSSLLLGLFIAPAAGQQPQLGGDVPKWFVDLQSKLLPDNEPAEEPPPPRPGIRLLPQFRDAVNWALEDLQALKANGAAAGVDVDTTVFRYVWVPDANPEDHGLVSFVLNSVVSRSDINYPIGHPKSPIQLVAGGRLVRFNLLLLCPLNNGQDYTTVSKLWDSLHNPYLLLEEAAQEFEEQTVTKKVPKTREVKTGKKVNKQFTENGRVVTKLVDETKIETFEDTVTETIRVPKRTVTKIFGPHVDVAAASTLQTLTACSNPLVDRNTLYVNALTQADGGRYYEFMGIRKANAAEKAKGFSDQDVWLLSMGVSEGLIDRLRADQRAAMITSNVTGKPRRIDVFDRPARTSRNQGLITITQDMLDSDADPKSDPFLNLIELKVGGREVVFERNNGHLGYVLFNGDGALVDEAPPNLVSDHLIPAPHTKRLQPAISCIRCHGRGNDGGWKPFRNEVRDALQGFLNVYDDTDGVQTQLPIPETLEKVARLYAGILDKPIRRAREDHSDAIVECTGNVAGPDGAPWQFHEVAKSLEARFTYYQYTAVTPEIACRELGYDVDGEQAAVTLLNRLLGRLAPAAGVPIQREDIRLGLLKQGTPINRFQWELVYIDAAQRALVNTPVLGFKSPDEPKK